MTFASTAIQSILSSSLISSSSPDHDAMSIDALLQAAEYLERRERGEGRGQAALAAFVAEAEHGYASALPLAALRRRHKSKKAGGTRSDIGSFERETNEGIRCRTSHNELEKNR